MWKKLDKRLLICFALTTLAGILLHDLFDKWPSILTEFIAPVNESLWEHIKLIFFPYLAAGLYLTGNGTWKRAPWLSSLLLICALLLIGGWLINSRMTGNTLAADVALYFVVMGLGFSLPAVLPVDERWSSLLTVAVLILCGLIVCWTIMPPNAALFDDLSLADTFYRLPC